MDSLTLSPLRRTEFRRSHNCAVWPELSIRFCCTSKLTASALLKIVSAGEANAPKLDDIRKQLADWRAGMPPYLRLDAAKGFAKIPPAHIINVKYVEVFWAQR